MNQNTSTFLKPFAEAIASRCDLVVDFGVKHQLFLRVDDFVTNPARLRLIATTKVARFPHEASYRTGSMTHTFTSILIAD